MTDEILSVKELEYHIASWQLQPSSGGTFEFTVNGDLLYSKKGTGRHAEPGEIKKLLETQIAKLRARQQ